jgi:hypothetical protein
MISIENNFLKNDFPENILRRKPFYTETNGALIFFIFYFLNNKLAVKIFLKKYIYIFKSILYFEFFC